ncbi:MAG: nitrate reductase molybdenum cofactor assembly chaperone, partial [Bowdeniella nasicola]|nr:nitrate reductase molybdenum cofactor assembly chaperone [Bowdeniella nasicola]
ALLNFADLFKAVGFEPPEFELPDYLPLLLQLSAQSKDVVVSEVLAAVHPGIEVTRTAVASLKSPYVHVFDALAATLPKLTDDQRKHVLRIINQGPPTELVGLSSKQLPLFVKGSS